MAINKEFQIRQAIFDWQTTPPTLHANVLLTIKEDGSPDEQQAKHVHLTGAAVDAAIAQLETLLLNKAQLQFPNKVVKIFAPPETNL